MLRRQIGRGGLPKRQNKSDSPCQHRPTSQYPVTAQSAPPPTARTVGSQVSQPAVEDGAKWEEKEALGTGRLPGKKIIAATSQLQHTTIAFGTTRGLDRQTFPMISVSISSPDLLPVMSQDHYQNRHTNSSCYSQISQLGDFSIQTGQWQRCNR